MTVTLSFIYRRCVAGGVAVGLAVGAALVHYTTKAEGGSGGASAAAATPSVPLHSDFKTPVPSDIAVSQSVKPLHISEVGKAAGIKSEELFPYGTDKAKVGVAAWVKMRERTRETQNGCFFFKVVK